MKMKYSALLLATSLLAAPAWLMAEPAVAEQPAQAPATSYQHKMQRNGEGQKAHGNMYKHGYQHSSQRGYQQHMSPEKFESYLTKRLETLETPELKAQFIKASQARLTAQAEQAQLKTMMAEQKAQGITDKALKEATLEKVAADQKLKQVRNKQLQDILTKANK